jgi:hypothetical protein
MSPAKVAVPKQAIIPIVDALSLEDLATMFQDFVQNVEKQIDAESDQKRVELQAESRPTVEAALLPGASKEDLEAAKTKRDAVVALIIALESQEARLRLAVKNAELLARRYKSRVAYLTSSIEIYMRDQQIEEIQGFMHRFKFYKQQDCLQITNEADIPAAYWDEIPVEPERRLNKEKLIAALEALKPGDDPIPGAFLERNRKRLDVK